MYIGLNRSRLTYLGNSPWDEEGCILGIRQHALGCVEEAEVSGTVNDDALDRHSEASVQTHESISSEDFGNAVAQASELSFSTTFAYIGGQPVMSFTTLSSCSQFAEANVPLYRRNKTWTENDNASSMWILGKLKLNLWLTAPKGATPVNYNWLACD